MQEKNIWILQVKALGMNPKIIALFLINQMIYRIREKREGVLIFRNLKIIMNNSKKS